MTREQLPSNQPHMQAERAVLGSLLRNPDTRFENEIRLLDVCFGHPMHQELWRILESLEADGSPIDLITVSEYAKETNKNNSLISVGDLIALTESAPVTQNFNYYAILVLKYYKARRTLEILNAHIAMGEYVKTDTIVDQLQRLIADTDEIDNPWQEWGDIGQELVEAAKAGKPSRYGYLKQTTYRKLDDMAPIHKGELAIVGAVTSGGKTAFAIGLCKGLADNGAKGLYLFYESTAQNIHTRVASMMTKITSRTITSGKMTPEQITKLEENMGILGNELTYRDESKNGGIDNIMSHVKAQMKKESYDYIVIDHLHQMPIKGKMREGIIDITNKFLSLAKSERIAVIALVQFRKAQSGESERRPTSAMIRESSTIAQDAHHVWILHDPQYLEEMAREQEEECYADKWNNHGNQNSPLPTGPKHAEIIVEKNREGETGIIAAEFDRKYVTWSEI